MKRLVLLIAIPCAFGGTVRAAHCTTVAQPDVVHEYEDYVARAERSMPQRFDSGELSWVPQSASTDSASRLASGKVVRFNIGDSALNARIAPHNGAVLDWIGAIRIRGTSLADLQAVLNDYDHYPRIYRPMIFACNAKRNQDASSASYDAVLGLHNSYRFAGVFPQHYSFRVKAH